MLLARVPLLLALADALPALAATHRCFATARGSRRAASKAPPTSPPPPAAAEPAAAEAAPAPAEGAPSAAGATQAAAPGKASKAVAAAAARRAVRADSDEGDVTQQRSTALNYAMQHLNKKLGSGTVMRLGDTSTAKLECIPSGCYTLDIALGGGWPRGRIVEIYGPESSGKSTLALHAIAEVQRSGGQAVLVDAEHAFNRDFAHKLGVRVKDLIINQPSCGEEALEVVDAMLRSGGVDLIAVDSVAALLPRAEQEGDIGQPQVAGQARMMSQALRKLTGTAAKANCTVIFVNQIRYKVGVLFGSPETTSGGNALKFYASQRVEVRVKERVKGPDRTTEVGVRVKAKVVKNKVAAPYRSAEFVIAFNKGMDKNASLLEAAELLGLVSARGSHYYYNQQRLGQGRDAVGTMLAGNAELREELASRVQAALRDPPSLEAALSRESDSDDEQPDQQGEAGAGPDVVVGSK